MTEKEPNLPDFGILKDLIGEWQGHGFNLIALPNFDSRSPSTGPSDFRLKLNKTDETLKFTAMNEPIANRGASAVQGETLIGQRDIYMAGITYLQSIIEPLTKKGLHREDGILLNVPATHVLPVQGQKIVRMGSIPHGSTFVLQSVKIETIEGPPTIPIIDSMPTHIEFTPVGYLDEYINSKRPLGITQEMVLNPNLLLQKEITDQKIIKTIQITLSTRPLGGLTSIPFVVLNANPTDMSITYWIETVERRDGSRFLQLQYSQNVNLNFLGIDWPHISVATLIKQITSFL